MEKIPQADVFYYVKYRNRDSEDPLGWKDRYGIFGIGIHEQMRPSMVRHGGRYYPWLLMYFHTPAIIRQENGEFANCENSMILWSPETSHVYGNPRQPWDHSWIIFKQDEIRAMVAKYKLPLNRPVHIPAAVPFEKYLNHFHEEISGNRKNDLELQKRLWDLFLYDLSRFVNQDRMEEEERIQRIRDYMIRNLSQPLTAADVAATFSISVSYLMYLFKRDGAASPMRFLYEKRMETAAFLLKCYPFSCKEIATRVGFPDPLNFSRRFKAFYGVAPQN